MTYQFSASFATAALRPLYSSSRHGPRRRKGRLPPPPRRGQRSRSTGGRRAVDRTDSAGSLPVRRQAHAQVARHSFSRRQRRQAGLRRIGEGHVASTLHHRHAEAGPRTGWRARGGAVHAARQEDFRRAHREPLQGRSGGLLPAARRSSHDVHAVSDRDFPDARPHSVHL